jgi:divalent metal cation (Fe/Co/Zn/Cd) transporter
VLASSENRTSSANRTQGEVDESVSVASTCGCPLHAGDEDPAERRRALGRALSLEYLTVAWNVIEGAVAVTAALGAGSIALLAFGVDSFIETSSGLIVLWRLRLETSHQEPIDVKRLDRRAHRSVGLSLLLLAAYVAVDALRALILHERPEPTAVGLALTAISLPVMLWLGRAKRRAARRVQSQAMQSDAFQTTACMWLSAITLVGVGLNAALGWSWADPVAALCMTYPLGREGLSAWRGQPCGC